MNPYAEDADGYRAAWAKGGYSKEAYMKAKAHWQAQPKFVLPPMSPIVTERERAARIVERHAKGCVTIPLCARIATEIRGGLP